MYEAIYKKHKLRARLVGFLGVLPGIFFILVTQTELGQRITLRCGYWILMLMAMSIIWLTYAVFVTKIIKDLRFAHKHAHSLTEQRFYSMTYYSMLFEALIASIIFVLSTVGFLLVDLRCFVNLYQTNPPF